MLKKIVFFILFLVSALPAAAQVIDLDRSRLSTAAYYNYSEQGDVTIKMHVWGAVRFPGLYEIPRGTRLSELISLTGGPQLGVRNKRSTTQISLKLHRFVDGERVLVHQVDMENQIVVHGEDPVVQAEDILSFEGIFQQGFRWRDVFPVVSMVGTLVLITERLRS